MSENLQRVFNKLQTQAQGTANGQQGTLHQQDVHNQQPKVLTKLITYIMAGDPDSAATVRRLQGLAESGVDILELGVPFSDPMADGPVIQEAAGRALAGGMTLAKTLAIVREFRATYTTPLLLMSYLNPLLRYGWDNFLQDAVLAGVDGLIIPDLPWREATPLRVRAQQLVGNKLTFIPMIAQTSEKQDIQALAQETRGFVYVLSRNGITGGEAEIPQKVLDFVQGLKDELQLPRCVGFGIRRREQVTKLAEVADGVVIGSALVQKFAEIDKELAANRIGEQEARAREAQVYTWIKELR